MNFTARSTTTASETTYDRFRPNWDSSGRHSRVKPLLRSNQALIIIDGAKHLNSVDDGRNNCWLKLIKRAQSIISQ